MHLALVQTLYRARGSPELAQISIDCPMQNCSRRSSLQARPRRYAFCTDQRFSFSGSPSPSFLFICTLHWCKHCTRLEEAQNLRKFPLTALCGIAADGVASRPFLVGTLFTPTKGLYFQALHPLSFLFMCSLHWCKHCTGLEVEPNLREFPWMMDECMNGWM